MPLPEGLENRGNEVEWGRRRHAERREERPGAGCSRTHTSYRTSRAAQAALSQGDTALVEWLVQRGCPYDPSNVLDSGHEHIVRWMFQQQDRIQSVHPAQVMRAMALQGNLTMIQWI